MKTLPENPTAADKLAWINTALEAGLTVYFRTYTRATRIDRKTVERFEKAGVKLLKVSGGSLWMASGRSYVCADLCGISIRRES